MILTEPTMLQVRLQINRQSNWLILTRSEYAGQATASSAIRPEEVATPKRRQNISHNMGPAHRQWNGHFRWSCRSLQTRLQVPLKMKVQRKMQRSGGSGERRGTPRPGPSL